MKSDNHQPITTDKLGNNTELSQQTDGQLFLNEFENMILSVNHQAMELLRKKRFSESL